MPLVTVRAHDTRIEYFGGNWKDDMFEVRAVDPPGGVNDTAGGVCMLGVASRETWGFGNGFRLSFTGVGVRLVMQSRQDHGFYLVDVDGAQSTVSGYSYAPHCGYSFVADDLPLGQHTISATLTGRNLGSKWPDNYMQMFAIQYDPGDPEPSKSNDSTGQTPQSSEEPPEPTPTAPVVPSESKRSSAISGGAIAGFTIAGLVVAFCIALLAVFLVRRNRHRRGAAHDESEKPLHMRRDAPAPYMLHPSAPGSVTSAGSAFTPQPLPDYARNDSPSVSPYPGGSQLPSSSAQPPPSSAARPGGKAVYMRAPPQPEEGETLLPPYGST